MAGCQDEPLATTTRTLPTATTREYAEEGYDGRQLLNDADGDGVCDEFEIAGAKVRRATATLMLPTTDHASTRGRL